MSYDGGRRLQRRRIEAVEKAGGSADVVPEKPAAGKRAQRKKATRLNVKPRRA